MNIMVVYVSQFFGKSGGMERVMCDLANAMVKREHTLSIVCCTEAKGKSFFPLDSRVRIYNLADFCEVRKWESKPYLTTGKKLYREMLRVFDRYRAKDYMLSLQSRWLRRAFHQVFDLTESDVIVSLEPLSSVYISNAMDKYKRKIPFITRFPFPVSVAADLNSKENRKALQKSRYCQLLTKVDMKSLKEKAPEIRTVYIPNVVSQYTYKKRGTEPHQILNVARFSKGQKQQHLLISAFAKAVGDFPGWKLVLLGSEFTRGYLEECKALARQLDIADRVVFHKPVPNAEVSDFYYQSDIFAFPSAYEGFSVALGEAMSAGLPAVGLKKCDSVSELIEDGRDGYLTEDTADALAEALKRLMGDPELRQRMGQYGHEAMKAFTADRVWNTWETVMKKVVLEERGN